MTFDEWWDTSRPAMTPDTFMGWEASCRQAWYAARKHEPESSTEAELLTALIRRGEMLVLSSLARGGALGPNVEAWFSDQLDHTGERRGNP